MYKRLGPDNVLPARAVFAGLRLDDFLHDGLPCASRNGGVGVLEINPRELNVHLRLAAGLVFRVQEIAGLCAVPCAQAFEPVRLSVERVENAFAAQE